MSSRILIGLILFFFASTGAVASDDYNAIFERAVNAIDFNFDENWAYTETQIDSEHVWAGRFGPRRPSRERWQLLTVDHRVPTEDEVEEYRKDKAHLTQPSMIAA